jgi:hypothetical protein
LPRDFGLWGMSLPANVRAPDEQRFILGSCVMGFEQ